ncbi:MAG: fibronectin type III domain-containing protein [Acidobacteria bacterium]|nr:fibronectin type III domain-containing protein [Acidobacteriota bacterium]
MTSVNIFYKRILPLLFLLVLVLAGCGSKKPPLPPLSEQSSRPSAPFVFQRGERIIVKITNPFVGQNGNDWEITLLRLRKLEAPVMKDDKKSKESEEDKLQKNHDIVPVARGTKSGRMPAFSEKMSEDEFSGSARVVYKLSSSDSSAKTAGTTIIYEDIEIDYQDSVFPPIYYYAIDVDDSTGKYEGISKIISISPMKITEPPNTLDYKEEEKKIVIKSKPDFSSEGLQTGVALYRGDCKSVNLFDISDEKTEIQPEDWKLSGILRSMHLEETDSAGKQIVFTRFVNSGAKGNGISQDLASDEETRKKYSGKSINITFRAKANTPTAIITIIDDGTTRQTADYKSELITDWVDYNIKYKIMDDPKKLTLKISIDEDNYKKEIDIADIKLSVVADKEGEAGEVIPVKNSNFERFNKVEFEDKGYKYGKKYCYYLASYLKYESNYYESEFGRPLEITPIDKFPPASPKGLYTLARLESVTLLWSPNSEKDFAGYNIYRRAENENKWKKLNDTLLTVTEYIDTPPVKNIKYFYYLRAVDNAPTPNESEPCHEVEFIARKDILKQGDAE